MNNQQLQELKDFIENKFSTVQMITDIILSQPNEWKGKNYSKIWSRIMKKCKNDEDRELVINSIIHINSCHEEKKTGEEEKRREEEKKLLNTYAYIEKNTYQDVLKNIYGDMDCWLSTEYGPNLWNILLQKSEGKTYNNIPDIFMKDPYKKIFDDTMSNMRRRREGKYDKKETLDDEGYMTILSLCRDKNNITFGEILKLTKSSPYWTDKNYGPLLWSDLLHIRGRRVMRYIPEEFRRVVRSGKKN